MSSDTPARLCVQVSGSSLSFLMFKLKNCQGDTEGFLYGHSSDRLIQEASDTAEQNQLIERNITITDFICFKTKFSFYDKCARLDENKCARIECLTRGTPANDRTVGWFSFRRNTTSGMSVREKCVHKSLYQLLGLNLLHLLLIETLSNQLVVEQLSLSLTTYTPGATGSFQLTPHSLKILNLNSTAVKGRIGYKVPNSRDGLSVTHSCSLDTILTPYHEQLTQKPPYLHSSNMINQISTGVLNRMADLKGHIMSNTQHIDQLKSEIALLSQDPAYSVDLKPTAPPSSLLIQISRKSMELPVKTAADQNAYQENKIINQDPHSQHSNPSLFPALDRSRLANSPLPDQPPPYSPPQPHGHNFHTPQPQNEPMDTGRVNHPETLHGANNNNNNNNKLRGYSIDKPGVAKNSSKIRKIDLSDDETSVI